MCLRNRSKQYNNSIADLPRSKVKSEDSNNTVISAKPFTTTASFLAQISPERQTRAAFASSA